MPRPPGGRTAAQSELASASSNPSSNALPKARITEQSRMPKSVPAKLGS